MDQAPSQSLAHWREQLWSTYARLESASQVDAFYGSVSMLVPGCTGLTIVNSTTQLTERTQANIRSDASEYVLVAFQRQGHGFAEQDDRRAETRPGEFVLYDTTRPYRLVFDGPFEQMVFRLPRRMLERCAVGFGNLMACRIDGRAGPGALVADFVDMLAQRAPQLDSRQFAEIEAAGAEFIGAALNVLGEGSENALEARYRRAIGALESHVEDPVFDLDDFASDLGMSVRTLQRLFSRQGTTPGRWLLQRRLEKVAGLLRAPAHAERTITALAFCCGFNDLGHFNRAFRARFGMSPSQWRAGGPGAARITCRS